MQAPCWVGRRADDLRELSQQPFHIGPAIPHIWSYGLRFPDLLTKPNAQPQLKWAYWRWPRHEYSRGDFENYPKLKLTTQWMVHEKTILQQCLLRNDGDDDIQIDVEFSKPMEIRDLDQFCLPNEFNRWTTRNHYVGPGPKGYSWVWMHRFPEASLGYGATRATDFTPNSVGNIDTRRSDTSPGRSPLPRNEGIETATHNSLEATT